MPNDDLPEAETIGLDDLTNDFVRQYLSKKVCGLQVDPADEVRVRMMLDLDVPEEIASAVKADYD